MPHPSFANDRYPGQPSLKECHALLMNAPMGIFTSTPEGRIIYANTALARLYGYDTPQSIIDSVKDIGSELYADPQDRAEFRRLLVTHGQVINFECRMFRRDGSVFWASMNARGVRDEKDEIAYFQGFTTDITERRQAEEQSRLSKEKFTKIFMIAPGCIAITRLSDGMVTDVNQGFEEITGWERSEALGRTSMEIRFWAHPVDRDVLVQELNCGRDVLNREFQFRRKDGAVRDGVYSARPLIIDGEPHLIFILRDITQAKATEEALRLTQFAMDRAPDSILWVDELGRIVYANHVACSSMGYTPAELQAMTVFEMDPDFPLDGWEQHKIDLKRQGRMSFEGRHYTKAGGVFPVEVTSNYIEYQGRFLAISFDRDTTERKKAEEERCKLQNQLLQAQKMESLGVLAGGVAHDFNNLLQVMSGNIQLLLKNKPIDHPDATRLKTVAKSIERGGQLVQQLLLFGRKAMVKRQVVDLNREVEEAVKILERTIPKMIHIDCVPAEYLWLVSADPIQVEQVLLNLGTNAVDAMPGGGTFLVETGNAVLDAGFIATHPGAVPGRYVLLTVSDTGCGMSKETLSHVFDPFFTTKEVGKGTGLGLASVYGIVKAHGGYIQCYSESGQGTTFKIYWPAEKGDDLSNHCPQEEQPQGGREVILVVDDDEEIRELTREILEPFGYTLICVGTGEQALSVCSDPAQRIDLVLLDLNMPGMGGKKCLQELLGRNPSARVLIVSGYTVNGHGKETLALGARGFISKPYQVNELAAKVRAALDE